MSSAALDWFAEDFSGGVRNRGREYFRGRAVTITKADGHQIVATVRGGQRYTVRIEWDEDVLRDGYTSYDCTCPYFRDNDEPCKHLWATLLTADAAGQLLTLRAQHWTVHATASVNSDGAIGVPDLSGVAGWPTDLGITFGSVNWSVSTDDGPFPEITLVAPTEEWVSRGIGWDGSSSPI